MSALEAACHMCAGQEDEIAGRVITDPVERVLPGTWEHESLDVPGLWATCLASHIRREPRQ